jgi:hypothetical protein
MRSTRLAFALLALALPRPALPAEETGTTPAPVSLVSFHVSPTIDIPVLDSAAHYTVSPRGSLALAFRMPFLPLLSLDVGLGYGFLPIRNADTLGQSLSVLSAQAGLGMQISLSPGFDLSARFGAGYGWGLINEIPPFRSGGSLLLEGGIGASVLLSKTVALEAGVAYRSHVGLAQSLAASVGLGFRIPRTVKAPPRESAPLRPQPLEAQPGAGLEVATPEYQSIFPVFHKFYDDNPVGTVVLRNAAGEAITGIKVSLDIKPYMTAPKTCAAPAALEAGQSSTIDLYALFSEEKILEVTEGSKASAEISWEYVLSGRTITKSRVDTVRILNRNAMTWEDDRRAAAFVTALDPSVLSFSKNVVGTAKVRTGGAVNGNLLTAIALYEAVCLQGITYWKDPKTPYVELSQKRTEVDFLQFPRQTLEYRAGDCDDLSILFAALFESLGIETAFITIPGHIFMAASLAIPPEEARRTFLHPDELILTDSATWLPIEITSLDGDFLKAWQTGAKEWRESQATGQAALYPLHEAWQRYEPVGLPGSGAQAAIPPAEKVAAAYRREVERFVDREIYPEVTRLQTDIQKSQGSAKALNKLGVLYARYDLLDRAEREFLEAAKKEETPAVLSNLGNLRYLQKDLEGALGYYERASRVAPDDARLVASLARVHHELENYGMAQKAYERLRGMDPALAEKFAYLGLRGEEATRAADATGTRGVILWAED